MADAEQLTWQAIRKYGNPDWNVIHSLWIKRHEYKEHAEIDFVLITDQAVLLLEVKGGKVHPRDDGKWQIGSRVETEGPFQQVRSAYYAIRDHIFNFANKDLFFDRVWGYGVILPECMLNIDERDPAISPKMLLDERNFPENLPAYIEELAEYWKEENIRLKENRHISAKKIKAISKSDRDLIDSLLRPLHRPGLSESVAARDAELEIIRLTEQQKLALEFHSEDKPLILNGAAGTGKTLLVLQQIQRRLLRGERILFVCFNKLLAAMVKKSIDPSYSKQFEVFNFHQLVGWLNQLGEVTQDDITDWKKFNSEVELRVMYALERIHEKGVEFEKFDHLVVDEAQDLMTAPFMDSLELLLKGGWNNGNWTMCLDTRQIIFNNQFDKKVLEKMKAIASECPLSRNCRNTKPVAAYAHGLSNTEGVPTREIEGPMPELIWYKDWDAYQKTLKKTVNELIHDMQDLAEKSRHIVILSFTKDGIPGKIFEKGFFKQPVDQISAERQPDRIQAGTLQSFKGLESTAIVLVGLEDVEHSTSRQLVYVGGTRAKLFLKILMPVRLKEDLKDRLSDILELLR